MMRTNFKVAVMEVRRKIVTVQAENEEAAHQRVYDAWQNAEFMLGADDFEGVEVSVLGEACDPGDFAVEMKGEI